MVENNEYTPHEYVENTWFYNNTETEIKDSYYVDNVTSAIVDDSDKFRDIEIIKKTIAWIHENFGNYVKVPNIPLNRSLNPYKTEVLSVLSGIHFTNRGAEKFIKERYNINMKMEHQAVLEKCIINNPYLILPEDNREFYSKKHSTDEICVMELEQSLYNAKVTSFLIFFRNDMPDTIPPCGWHEV